MNKAAEELAAAVDQTADTSVRQEVVSPEGSFIVQAPAGSGKTRLLVQRYINLLSVVRQPEEILAITFTDKAAREMKTRVIKELSDEESEEAIRALDRSKKLGWDITLNTQRMRIQTIDSFAYGLVQRMPYESQLSLDYSDIDNADEVYLDAAAEFFLTIFEHKKQAEMVVEVLGLFDNNLGTATKTLADMLKARQNWIQPILTVLREYQEERDFDRIFELLEETRNRYIHDLIQSVREQIGEEFLSLSFPLCEQTTRVLNCTFHNFDHLEDWQHLCDLFLTKQGELRKRIDRRQGVQKTDYLSLPDEHEDEKVDSKSYWMKMREYIEQSSIDKVLQRLIGVCKGSIAPEQREQFKNLCLALPLLIEKLNTVFRYRECVDFVELNFAAQRALAIEDRPTDLALALDYRISHILIDEYQDTSESQFNFFEKIMSGWSPDSGNTFFAVGDPMQSIYRFRNANLSLFQRTYKEGLSNVDVSPRQLTSNFRTLPELVESVNEVFEQIFGIREDSNEGAVAFARSFAANNKFEKHSADEPFSMTLCFNDPDGQSEAIEAASRIAQIRDLYPQEETVALLVPTRTRLSNYLRALREKGLRWKGVDIVKLVDEPVVRDLYTLVEVYQDDRNRLAWLSFFRSPMCGLSLQDLETLATYSLGSQMLKCPNLSERGSVALTRVKKAFSTAEDERHLTIRSQVERLWYRLGGVDAYGEEDSLVNAERFLELLEASTLGNIRLDELWSRIEGEYATESGVNADVDIMTIHKAKGLEFDHVVLVDCNRRGQTSTQEIVKWLEYKNSLLIAINDKEHEDPFYSFIKREEAIRDENERKRVLYVAMTRAKQTLSIFGQFKSDEIKVTSGSLFKFLEPFFDRAKTVSTFQKVTAVAERSSLMLTRLDPEYEWDDPVPKVGLNDEYTNPIDLTVSVVNPINFQRELVLGTLVHRELHRIAVHGKGRLEFSEQRKSSWRNYLQMQGVGGEDVPRLLERTQTQLENVLNDHQGRWMLDQNHFDAQSEAKFTGYLEGEIKNIVIDRTFVDEEGTRWIIDFKTTAFPHIVDRADIVRETQRRHGRQLSSYVQIVGGIEARKIRCAVYYTDIPMFVELD